MPRTKTMRKVIKGFMCVEHFKMKNPFKFENMLFIHEKNRLGKEFVSVTISPSRPTKK